MSRPAFVGSRSRALGGEPRLRMASAPGTSRDDRRAGRSVGDDRGPALPMNRSDGGRRLLLTRGPMSSVDRVLDVSLGGVPSVAASADEAPSWKRALSNSLALGTGDLLSISVSILLAQTVVYWGLGGSYGVPVWASSLVALWFAGAALLHLLPGWGLGPGEELRRVTTLLVGVFGTLIVTTFYGNALAGLYLSTAAASLRSVSPRRALRPTSTSWARRASRTSAFAVKPSHRRGSISGTTLRWRMRSRLSRACGRTSLRAASTRCTS